MEINREQLIRELDCCVYDETCAACETVNCSYNKLGSDCISGIMTDALSLIKELMEENDMLKEQNAGLVKEAVFSPMERAHHTIVVRTATAEMMREKIYTELEAMCRAKDAYIPFPLTWLDKITEDISGGTYGKD
jgi:hypothetical protein